jgi:hypothetical protein
MDLVWRFKMIHKRDIILSLILSILLLSGCVSTKEKEPVVLSGNQINESELLNNTVIMSEYINFSNNITALNGTTYIESPGIITGINSTVYNETILAINTTGNYSNITNST